jgi:3-methyladenine DNA glycosylase Tag
MVVVFTFGFFEFARFSSGMEKIVLTQVQIQSELKKENLMEDAKIIRQGKGLAAERVNAYSLLDIHLSEELL